MGSASPTSPKSVFSRPPLQPLGSNLPGEPFSPSPERIVSVRVGSVRTPTRAPAERAPRLVPACRQRRQQPSARLRERGGGGIFGSPRSPLVWQGNARRDKTPQLVRPLDNTLGDSLARGVGWGCKRWKRSRHGHAAGWARYGMCVLAAESSPVEVVP